MQAAVVLVGCFMGSDIECAAMKHGLSSARHHLPVSARLARTEGVCVCVSEFHSPL